MLNKILKFIKNILISNVAHWVIIIFITITIFGTTIKTSGYTSWADNASPRVLNIEKYNNISNFTYAENVSGLIFNTNLIVTHFIPNKIASTLSLFINNTRLLILFWVILPYVVLHLSLYLSLKMVLKEKNISLILTLLYMGSLLGLTQIAYGWDTTIYSQAAGLLSLSLFIKYLKNPKLYYVSSISLLSLIGFVNIANYYAILLIFVFYFIVYVILSSISISRVLELYKNIIFLPILMFLINSYWLLPLPFMARETGFVKDFVNIYDTSVLTILNTFNYITSFSLFEQANNVFGFFHSSIYRITFTYLLMLVIYGISIKTTRKDVTSKISIIMFLLIFSLSLGDRSGIIWKLLNNLPGFFILRSPQLKFYPYLFYFFLLMLGWLVTKYEVKKLVFLTVFITILGFLGIRRGDLFKHWKNISLPSDYSAVVNYLSDDSNKFSSVMKYPPTRGGPKLSWRDDIYSYPIIDNMIYNPIIVRTWGDSQVPVYLRGVYNEGGGRISEVIGSGGVKFIIVHKDYSDYRVRYDFEDDQYFEPIITGENIDLYKVSNAVYKPLFYNNNQHLNYIRVNPVMHLVNTNPGNMIIFNRQHDVSLSLYDKEDLQKIGYYKCNMSIGNLNLCDIYLLRANPLPKEPLDKEFKNRWVTPFDTSGTYVVYYTPQIYFYIGLIISFAVFLLNIFLIIKYKIYYGGTGK